MDGDAAAEPNRAIVVAGGDPVPAHIATLLPPAAVVIAADSGADHAAALGLRWIHAGIGSVEAKARRGARLRPLWLVDLAPDSSLAAVPDRIRSHNRRGYEQLLADSRTEQSLVDRESWEAFL